MEKQKQGQEQPKKRKRYVLAAVLLSLLFCCAAAAEKADPVVIRVGDYEYTESLVSFTMRITADQNGLFWELLSPEEKEVIRDAVVNQIIGIGIIENKLKEQGRHDFSSAEEEQLRAYAQQQYDQSWLGLQQYLSENGVDVTPKEVSEWLDMRGYTLDMYYQSALAAERQFIMFGLYCDIPEPTEDEIDAYYLETFVEPDREKYAEHIDTYETEILTKGSESFYVPEGYRYIRWVTVPYPEEIREEAQPAALKVSLTDELVLEAYNRLGRAAAQVADLNDLRPYRDDYDAAVAENQTAGAVLTEILQKALPEAERVKADISRCLEDGMPFHSAVSFYDEAQIYADPSAEASMFHPDSTAWNNAVREAMASLTEPGQLSDPVITADGMIIFYYEGDVPSGAHALTGSERELVKQNAVYTAQLAKLNSLIEDWKPDYRIETDISLIHLD